ncbi:Zinc finger MYM-type protein 1, partial [Linum perenne]
LRYVDKTGSVVERFLGISHVANTKALTLRNEIESMLLKHGLNFSKIRGQGYDGASNMKGEINGLKTLILSKTPSAYYIHCFAHQLQLTLVAVARNHGEISLFFNVVSVLTNLVGASCKRRDIVRETQAEKVADAISCGEIETGRGLNQEILSITNDLSIALQKKDQDIVNAMHLVNVAKQRLQHLRDCGWESLLDDVVAFCVKEDIRVVEMNDAYVPPGRSRRKGQ